jgi:serine phosphatase RsbU (regulator of sigma subunit)
LFFTTILLFPTHYFAQINNVKSTVKCQEKADSLYDLSNDLQGADNVKCLFIAQELYKLSKECNTIEITYKAYDAFCWAYLYNSNFPEAIRYGDKALDLSLQLNDTFKIINSYNVLGNIYLELPDKDFALSNFSKGIDLSIKIGDEELTSNFYNNIAIAYELFDDLETSLIFYKKAKAYYEKMDIDSDKALIYLNIGDLFVQTNQLDSASYYLSKSRSLINKEEDEYLLLVLYLSKASEQSKNKNYSNALLYLDSCYQQIISGGTPYDFLTYSKLRSEILFESSNYKDAYHYLLDAYKLKDSLSSKDIINKLRDVQISAIKDQKEAEISELTQKNTIQDLAIAEQEAKERNLFLGIMLISIVLFFLIFVMFNNVKKNKKLHYRSQIIEQQSKDISLKNNQLEQSNKEITDSIIYAKRIQNAILPPNRIVKKYLPESFILYRPKDIVAGDFYWMEEKNGKIFIAAADCTGHGVPGAMVSVICNNGLNRSVREHGIIDTGRILDKTREIIIQEFEKSDEDVKDGMDISLLCLNTDEYEDSDDFVKVQWSGANNPLWIIRNGKFEIEEIKPDKQPVGKYAESQNFTSHNFYLHKGDTIYLLTDGFQDQFGGEKGKKFKALQLKELLISISKQEMNIQHQILVDTFEEWRGSIEQIDDVCIVGIRL